MKTKLLAAPALLAAAAMVLAGCSQGSDGAAEPADASPIVIGTAVSLTGDLQAVGTGVRAGAQYAVDEINEAGGLLGRDVVFDARDDQSKPDQAVVAFNELAESATAFLGPGSSNSALAVIDIVERQQIPLVSPAATEEQVEPIRDYVFQAPSSSSAVGVQMAEGLAEQDVSSIFAVVNTQEGGLTAGWAGMQEQLSELDIEIAGTAEVAFTTLDYTAAITQAQSSGADAIVAWLGGPPATTFATQLAASASDQLAMFPNAVAAGYFLEGGADAVNGMLIAAPLPGVASSLPESALRDEAESMIAGFTAANGTAPDQFVFNGYAAMQVIFDAIEQAGSTEHAAIQEALADLQADTILGPIAYSDENHTGPGPEYTAIARIIDNVMVAEPTTVERLAALLQ